MKFYHDILEYNIPSIRILYSIHVKIYGLHLNCIAIQILWGSRKPVSVGKKKYTSNEKTIKISSSHNY
jgi:hypothetical protein